ncbi:MAG: CoA transferase [Desertimonas sp.]
MNDDSTSGGDGAAYTVLDLSTTLAGAYACHLLATAGVHVVRAEPPGGHRLRRWSATGSPPPAEGALFRWLAGGQESVTVDRDRPDDIDALRTLAGRVDGVVWSGAAGDGTHPLLELADVEVAADGGVVVAMTPFGRSGPWAERPATEFTLQALSGGPALRGSRQWPPMSAGGQHGEYMIGVFGAVAALIGLRARQATGRTGTYDVAGLEAIMMTQLFNPITMQTSVGGVRPKRPLATVGDVVASKDGWVGFAVVNRLEHWHDFCAMIGRVDWADDRSLDPPAARNERPDELIGPIQEWTQARTTAEIVELATLMRIPSIEVGNGRSIPEMDHFATAGFYEREPDSGVLQPAPPFRLHPPMDGAGTGTAPSAPAPGPPICEVRERRRAERPPYPTTPPGDTLPFAGLRIADFTSFWAGPFLTHTMGMFGADVIHVESTVRPDGARLMTHHSTDEDRWWEWSSYFQATNTNKRDVTVDLSTDVGRDLAQRLVAECDVVVENYSPRVMEGFGLGWDDVRARRPDTVMVRMPAFGLSGPWRDRTGFAMTMEQVSGMAWLTGFPEHRPAALFGPCDPGAGLHACVGLLAALERRRRTGQGSLVEAPMVASALNVAAEQVIEYSATGHLLERAGNRGAAAAPQNCYASAERLDDDSEPRWVAVAVANDQQWAGLRQALGDPDWAAATELATADGRRHHHDDIDQRLDAWCAERPAAEIVAQLRAHGVPAEEVVHPEAQLDYDQLAARSFWETVEHPVSGPSIHSTYPFRLPGLDGPVHRRAAPLLGEHTAEVLGELLGVTAGELDSLAAAGVIGTAPPT